MSMYFKLSILFLDPVFHGLKEQEKPEWPPSPLRVFQTLVAATASRWRGEDLVLQAKSALQWLEQQAPPIINAPKARSSSGYRMSVPNNAMDVVAKAWSRGNYSNTGDASPATHRAMKTICATHLIDGDTVTYFWLLNDPLASEDLGHIKTLCEVAHSIVALGWGIDMAIGHAELVSELQPISFPEDQWLPTGMENPDGLRIPMHGTLDDLTNRHKIFLRRISSENTMRSTPKVRVCRSVIYRRASDVPSRPVAAFALRKPDDSGFSAFDASRRALTVAGMMRHAVKNAAIQAGWSEKDINSFVLGHGETKNSNHVAVGPKRFAYLPLPSIEARGAASNRVVGSVRRMLITCYAENGEDKIVWAEKTLSGFELVPETSPKEEAKRKVVTVLSKINVASDKILPYYLPQNGAVSWSTVTPMVLPGYDDPAHLRRKFKDIRNAEEQKHLLERLNTRIDGLIRKAIVQAGFSNVLAEHADIEWRKVGFWPGTEHADKYGVPDHLKRFPRYHIKICWNNAKGEPAPVSGPVCIGGGRYYGLGLFAAMRD